MKKFRNYSFWIALTGTIVILVQSIGNIFGFEIQNGVIENLIMSICGVLVVLGIVIKPKDNPNTDEENSTKNKDIDKENKVDELNSFDNQELDK